MTTHQKKPKVISFVNLKGGVGKTALAVNFAAYCGQNKLKTLLVDLDPQTNATFSCMSVESWEKHAAERGTVANLLGVRQHTSAEGKIKSATEIIVSNVFGQGIGFDLIPSHLDLFTIDLDLGSEVARETRLRRSLKDVLGNYDIVICDCPPNLTLPTQNALSASTHYIVPVSPDYLSGIGVALLLSRVKKLGDDLENPIELAGLVMSRVGRPSYFRTQTIDTLRKAFGEKVLYTEIKERSVVSESAAKNISVFGMNDELASDEFYQFGKELLSKLGVK